MPIGFKKPRHVFQQGLTINGTVNVNSGNVEVGDDREFVLGNADDILLRHSNPARSANEEVSGLIKGDGSGSVHQGFAGTTLVVSNIFNNGDMIGLIANGNDSHEWFLADASALALILGHAMTTVTIKTASGQLTLSPGGYVDLTAQLKLLITDTDGTVEGQIWYDASEDKLKFKTAAGVETITSA